MNPRPKVTIVAGPNGSGKTTFAKKYLQDSDVPFLNADEIAQGISPGEVSRVALSAGKEYFRRLDQLIDSRSTFVFESTLSGVGTARIIKNLKDSGFSVAITYLFLETPETCISRITERVSNGGHHVPDKDVVRRYWRSKKNFWLNYKDLADEWCIFTNTNDSFEEVAFGDSSGHEISNVNKFAVFMQGVQGD